MTFPVREVDAHVKQLVSRSRHLYPTLYLNQHDRDDLAQTITLHVMDKWGQHKGDKWKGWVNQIGRNRTINWLRDRILAASKMPTSSMITRTVQHDDTGDEELVYEPDMAAQEDGVARTMEALDELPEHEARFLREYVRFGTWKRVGRVTRMSGQMAYRRGMRAAARVKAML